MILDGCVADDLNRTTDRFSSRPSSGTLRGSAAGMRSRAVSPFGRGDECGRDVRLCVREYADGMIAGSVGRCESARELAGDRPPTDDDVPIARDGRRLDSPAKVLAFLEEINAQRSSVASRG